MIPFTMVLLLVFLALSVPVGVSLGFLGVAVDSLFSPMPLTLALGEIVWSASSDFLLASVPLFVLLGEILLRSGIADRLYASMVQWMSWLPGGLMHSNVGSCMAFAATAGSSVATAATIGTVAMPLVERHRYNQRLFLGSLAAGGTLGILIPPSINLIIYGWLTETSVPKLYLAGFLPGVVLGSLFSLTILIGCLIVPRWGGDPIETSWRQRIASLPALIPPLLIFLLVVGSIYAGLATPTESAALGVVGALILAAANRRLNFQMLRQAIEGCMRTTGMIMLIVTGAWFLNFVLSATGFTAAVHTFLTGQGLTPLETLVLVVVFYIILGCFMEPMPMMIVTVPIITPIMVSAGFDPVWFGILVVLLIETAMITPPVGINLFVVQGVRGRGSLNDVMIGASPFVLTLMIMILLIILFPDIVLWLPSLIGN